MLLLGYAMLTRRSDLVHIDVADLALVDQGLAGLAGRARAHQRFGISAGAPSCPAGLLTASAIRAQLQAPTAAASRESHRTHEAGRTALRPRRPGDLLVTRPRPGRRGGVATQRKLSHRRGILGGSWRRPRPETNPHIGSDDVVSRGKKVTPQTLVGEAGIALIHRRVTEMGFLFHPRRVDHGIDGHIDLVDPGTHEVLNLVLLVQSKASGLAFPYETETSFQYTCEGTDLNYWLSGNAPVILVLSHPERGEAWWVDIKGELADPKRRASRTVVVDKRRQAFDQSAAPALLGRALPKDSGLFLSAPPKPETLTSNLLRIEAMPEVIYIAPAAATTYPAAGELLTAEPGRGRGDWILRDGLVISFSNLPEAPLKVLCAGDVEQHDTAEWANSDDTDTQHRFMDLLSRTLRADHRGDLRWHNDRKHLHFCPTPNLRPRREGRSAGRRGHTVFGPYRSKKDPDTVSFYRHAALTTKFRRLAGIWYCQLGTDYCFTRDGRQEYQFADTLLAGIKRLDRHAAVAGWTKTWATYLTQQPHLFASEKALIFGGLETFEADRGIDDRLWGPAPVQPRDEDADGPGDPAEVEAALAAVGIETADLFALDDDEADLDELPDSPASARRHKPNRQVPTAATNKPAPRRGGKP